MKSKFTTALIPFIDFFVFIFMSEENFNYKYGTNIRDYTENLTFL